MSPARRRPSGRSSGSGPEAAPRSTSWQGPGRSVCSVQTCPGSSATPHEPNEVGKGILLMQGAKGEIAQNLDVGAVGVRQTGCPE